MIKYFVQTLFFLAISTIYSQNPFFVQKGTENWAIYRNFANDIWLYTPNICEDVSFTIKISDADFWQNSTDKRHLKIVPRGNKAKIEMRYFDTDGKEVYWEKTLYVIDPPAEYYHFFVDGKWTNSPNVPIDKNSKITFQIVKDTDFSTLMGSQADYRVDSIKIYILPPNNHPPEYITTLGFDIHQHQDILSIPLPPKCFTYGSGTKIYAEVKDVYRRNAKGEWINFFVRASYFDKTGIFYVK